MDIIQTFDGAFNPVLLLPVLVVVVGVVTVFVFGFKKPTNPNFRKIVSEHSSVPGSISSGIKRQKRTLTTEAPTSAQHQHIKNTATVKAKKEAPVDTVISKVASALVNKSKTQNIASKDVNKKAGAGKVGSNAKEKKSNARNAEKPLDDGGEWQTVVTKKQKKNSTTNDLLIQAVAKAAAGASLTLAGAKENKVLLKNNNNKQAKEQANKTKKASAEQQKLIKDSAAVADNKLLEEEFKTKTTAAAIETLENTVTIPDLDDVAAAHPVKLQKAAAEVSADSAAEVPIPAVQDTSLVFDELRDATWMEAKAPKKSKKRALRE